MVFGKMLGIEINEGYINLGYRKGKKLLGFTRVEAPVADGEILDLPIVKKTIEGYAAANRPGKAVMLTVKTSKAILRKFVPEHDVKVPLFGKGSTELLGLAGELFPVDTAGYAVDYRLLDNESALMCCLPGKMSDGLAGMLSDIGLTPVCIDVYENSLSLAMERSGGNAVCVTDKGMFIYIEDGRLKDIGFIDRAAELETALAGLSETAVQGYNPARSGWVSEAFDSAGVFEVESDDSFALRGLLHVGIEKYKSADRKI